MAYLGGAIGFGSCCGLLQSLALADCKRMSDAALLVLAKGCPSLRFLNLSGCGKVRLVCTIYPHFRSKCRVAVVLADMHIFSRGCTCGVFPRAPRGVTLRWKLNGMVVRITLLQEASSADCHTDQRFALFSRAIGYRLLAFGHPLIILWYRRSPPEASSISPEAAQRWRC